MGGQRLCHGSVLWADLEVMGKSFLHVLLNDARAEVGHLLFPQYLSVFSSSPSSSEGMRDNSSSLSCFVGFFPAYSPLTLRGYFAFIYYLLYLLYMGFFSFTLLFPLLPYISHVQLSSCVCFGAYSVFSLNYFMKCKLLALLLDATNNPYIILCFKMLTYSHITQCSRVCVCGKP